MLYQAEHCVTVGPVVLRRTHRRFFKKSSASTSSFGTCRLIFSILHSAAHSGVDGCKPTHSFWPTNWCQKPSMSPWLLMHLMQDLMVQSFRSVPRVVLTYHDSCQITVEAAPDVRETHVRSSTYQRTWICLGICLRMQIELEKLTTRDECLLALLYPEFYLLLYYCSVVIINSIQHTFGRRHR
jgi:hypothetical protein